MNPFWNLASTFRTPKPIEIGLLVLGFWAGGCVSQIFKLGTIPKEAECIAVLPFEVRFDVNASSEMLSEFVALDLYRKGARGVIGPREVEQLFRSAKEPLPPSIDPFWAKEVGAKLHVDGVVFGSVTRLPVYRSDEVGGDALHLNVDAYFLNIKSGEIQWTYGIKEVAPTKGFVGRLSSHAEDMTQSLLLQHRDNLPFGKGDCWISPGSLAQQVAAVEPTPTPIPTPVLTESQKTILEQLNSSEGLIYESTFFVDRTAVLAKESVPELRELHAALAHPDAPRRIQIDAHLDGTADDADDLRISKARAEAIQQYLSNLGLQSSRMEAFGRGNSKPLVPNINARSRRLNRRVEITALKTNAP